MDGIYFDIKRYAINDGPGIRTTVFLKGCPLSCVWCHNPQGISPLAHIDFRESRCKSCGACAAVCEHGLRPNECSRCKRCVDACAFDARRTVGRSIAPEGLIHLVERDRPFFEQSGGGVTFSGGEPLMQPEFLRECLELCKSRGLHTAVDTSGYASARSLLGLLLATDLVLFDLKIIDPAEHAAYTGVDNAGILENLKLLDEKGAQIWIRVPFVPGITGSDENIEAIGEVVSRLKNVSRVSLLPYHGLAAPRSIPKPTDESLDRAKRILQRYGLDVYLKG